MHALSDIDMARWGSRVRGSLGIGGIGDSDRYIRCGGINSSSSFSTTVRQQECIGQFEDKGGTRYTDTRGLLAEAWDERGGSSGGQVGQTYNHRFQRLARV